MPSDTLEDALSALTVPTLRSMMELLPVPKPRPKLKAGMVDAIRLRLTGKSLRELWERLDESQRLAVTETLFGLGVRFNANRFRAKYGVLPKGFGPANADKVSLLRFFFSRRTGTGISCPPRSRETLRNNSGNSYPSRSCRPSPRWRKLRISDHCVT